MSSANSAEAGVRASRPAHRPPTPTRTSTTASYPSCSRGPPSIFQGSIRDKISLGIDLDDTAPVPDADMEATLGADNAWDFVASLPDDILPDGMATSVGPLAQRHKNIGRPTAARRHLRALIRGPKVLLLDEATSARREMADVEDKARMSRQKGTGGTEAGLGWGSFDGWTWARDAWVRA